MPALYHREFAGCRFEVECERNGKLVECGGRVGLAVAPGGLSVKV